MTCKMAWSRPPSILIAIARVLADNPPNFGSEGTKMQRIRSIGVLSLAKVSGLCYGAMGLLLAPIFLLFAAIGSMVPRQPGMAGFPAVFGVAFAICAPILYGAMGFVMGALGAFIYNLIAGWIGGIEIELQPGSAPPVTYPTP
jgi:uncharacterized membrane protein YhdT